jgi:hypothetical protein
MLEQPDVFKNPRNCRGGFKNLPTLPQACLLLDLSALF